MNVIGQEKLSTFLSTGWKSPVDYMEIRGDPGYLVENYSDLVECVAKLSLHNQHHVLLYRGQGREYHMVTDETRFTVIKPSIFRAIMGQPSPVAFPQRYETLIHADKLLSEKWLLHGLEESDPIVRHRILRWSILQHYEVCRTPLLDVTNSLRVAASIAALTSKNDFAYLYVLGVPQLSGAITASAEAGLQIIRLSELRGAVIPYYQMAIGSKFTRPFSVEWDESAKIVASP